MRNVDGRDKSEQHIGGYPMNKSHWNDRFLHETIDLASEGVDIAEHDLEWFLSVFYSEGLWWRISVHNGIAYTWCEE